MAKQSYTEVLIEFKEFIARINERDISLVNHLRNIDSHLDGLNNSVAKNKERSQKNQNNIGWIIKIGGGLGGLAIIVVTILNIAGVI